MLTPEMRGFLKLLGLLGAVLVVLGLMFWPYIAIWLSDFFGV